MPAAQGALQINAISRRWLILAERRLAYYTELYRSGRWAHYYADREAFAVRMLDVIKAAKVWRELAGEPPAAPVAVDDLLSAA